MAEYRSFLIWLEYRLPFFGWYEMIKSLGYAIKPFIQSLYSCRIGNTHIILWNCVFCTINTVDWAFHPEPVPRPVAVEQGIRRTVYYPLAMGKSRGLRHRHTKSRIVVHQKKLFVIQWRPVFDHDFNEIFPPRIADPVRRKKIPLMKTLQLHVQ